MSSFVPPAKPTTYDEAPIKFHTTSLRRFALLPEEAILSDGKTNTS